MTFCTRLLLVCLFFLVSGSVSIRSAVAQPVQEQVDQLTSKSSSKQGDEEEEEKEAREAARDSTSDVSKYYFKIDELNEGLGDRPGKIDLETPQSALESFLQAARDDDYEAAAHVLDLRDIAPDEQRVEGAALANHLAQVIQRKVLIRWDDIVDRPDALNAFASPKNPIAGDVRRSLRLERLDLEGRPVSIRLHRLKPENAEPVWVFSRQTVGNVEALHELYGPSWIESWMPGALKRDAFLGIAWWEVIAFPLIFLLAIMAALGVYKSLSWVERKVEHKRWSDVVERACTPAALFVGVLLMQTLTQGVFTFSASINTFLRPLLIGVVILTGLLVVLRVIDTALAVLERREVGEQSIDDEENVDLRRRYTNIYAVRRITLVIVVVIGLGILLVETDILQTLGLSLLATAGVVSIVLGLAAQTILGNILSSLQIAIAKPIHIGDSVYYEGDWAYVEAIHYTYVELRTWDLRRLIVPVTYFVSNTFENWSKKDPHMIKPVAIVLDHCADVEQLRQYWEEIARQEEEVEDDEWIRTLVTDHDARGMTVKFYCSATDPTAAWRINCKLREKMLTYIQEHGAAWPLEREFQLSSLDQDSENEQEQPPAGLPAA